MLAAMLAAALLAACMAQAFPAAAAQDAASNATARAAAELCLNNSRQVMDELLAGGFGVQQVNDTIKIAAEVYDTQLARERSKLGADYTVVIGYCNQIDGIRAVAYSAKDELYSLEKNYADFKAAVAGYDLNTTDVDLLMNETRRMMADERYDKALENVPAARKEMIDVQAGATTLNLFYKTVSRGLVDIVYENWPVLAGIAVFIAAFAVFYRLRLRKVILKRRIARREVEKKVVLNMIGSTQKAYFKGGGMAESEYRIKTKKFAEIIRDIERQIPLLREELAKMGVRERALEPAEAGERKAVKKRGKKAKIARKEGRKGRT
jgi:hypothetical protein